MKKITLITLITVIIHAGSAHAGELLKISRARAKDTVQLYLDFDKSPRFSTNADKRRIDIVFYNSSKVKDLKMISEDNDIVKILTKEIDGKLIFSFFFRYQPQTFKVIPSGHSTVVFDVLLGNEYSKSYKDLAKRLKGLTIVDRQTIDFNNPYIASPYTQNWLSFYSEYESPVHIEVPVTFSVPEFPIVALLPPALDKNKDLFSKEMRNLATQGLWDHLNSLLLDTISQTKNIEHQKLLALTYGETLLRSDDFEGAFKQLYLLEEKFREELLSVYAQYMLVLLQAIHQDPLLADFNLRKLEPEIPDHLAIAPFFLLSRIETALSGKMYPRMNKLLLNDSIGLPPDVKNKVIIRQADYWYAIQRPVKAYASYNLLADSRVLRRQPYSFNGYCATLYEQKKFRNAAKSYKFLSTLVTEREPLSLISYRANMAKLKFTPGEQMIDAFALTETAFENTEGGYLAAIKKNDLLFLLTDENPEEILKNYLQIADNASKRNIREEALFKGILLHVLQGRKGLAIDMLMDFLRNFRSGNVKTSAQALLIELLPEEIKRLVDAGEYVKALVLAKKNRAFFQQNWIDSKFLVDIARAYHQIGIFDEAQKLYLYLIEIMPADRRENFYLPMIKATYDHGNYSLVDDYAAQYAYNYPDGKYADDILFLRISALAYNERLEDAEALLPDPLPDEVKYYRLTSMLYFRLNKYQKSLASLQALELSDKLTEQEKFLLAENFYQLEQYSFMEQAYNDISEDNPFYEQSLYRLAELARMKGDEKKVLSLLKEIVEKGKNSRWKELAERELQYNKLKNIY
ncbi:MAG: hypothetical protein CR992_00035 [Desulfobacterales bacterium]|nr:MAG: hypothetical protein CR992_00035 [Desulfobacterales bacterium]